MKRILFLAAFMLLSMAASAQDIIVKKNGEEIRAKVEEAGERSFALSMALLFIVNGSL